MIRQLTLQQWHILQKVLQHAEQSPSPVVVDKEIPSYVALREKISHNIAVMHKARARRDVRRRPKRFSSGIDIH